MALSGGLSATYVDASTFKLSGETDSNGVPYVDIFTTGRRVRADCGTDGIVYSEAMSASYDGTADETTVNLDDAVLTSNLDKIWFGVSGESALPKHSHAGDASGGLISIKLNSKVISSDITIPATSHGMSVGPLDIEADITIADNSVWEIL